MFNKVKNNLKVVSEERKTLALSKGAMNFNVAFRIDIKEEMKYLLEILDEAKSQIEKELKIRFK